MSTRPGRQLKPEWNSNLNSAATAALPLRLQTVAPLFGERNVVFTTHQLKCLKHIPIQQDANAKSAIEMNEDGQWSIGHKMKSSDLNSNLSALSLLMLLVKYPTFCILQQFYNENF